LLAQRQTGSSKTIRQKAEVTDADEAFGQHVQKEARLAREILDEIFGLGPLDNY
jgi:hypothetical protein